MRFWIRTLSVLQNRGYTTLFRPISRRVVHETWFSENANKSKMHWKSVGSYLHGMATEYSEEYTLSDFGGLDFLQIKSLFYSNGEPHTVLYETRVTGQEESGCVPRKYYALFCHVLLLHHFTRILSVPNSFFFFFFFFFFFLGGCRALGSVGGVGVCVVCGGVCLFCKVYVLTVLCWVWFQHFKCLGIIGYKL